MDPDHEWNAQLAEARRKEPSPLVLLTLDGEIHGGASRVFPVIADDSRRYWVKGLLLSRGEEQGISLFVEQLVSRLGGLFDAPVIEARLVMLREPFLSSYADLHSLVRSGPAHASIDIEGAVDTQTVPGKWTELVNDPQNRAHSARLAVLYGWLFDMLVDSQLLFTPGVAGFYAHDHSHQWKYMGCWPGSEVALSYHAHLAYRFAKRLRTGCYADPFVNDWEVPEIRQSLEQLSAVTESDLVWAVASCPRGWEITDQQLIDVLSYLKHRRRSLVRRLGA